MAAAPCESRSCKQGTPAELVIVPWRAKGDPPNTVEAPIHIAAESRKQKTTGVTALLIGLGSTIGAPATVSTTNAAAAVRLPEAGLVLSIGQLYKCLRHRQLKP